MAKNSIIPIFVPHLGCPHKCVFCNQNHISGAIKPPDAEFVRQEVSRFPSAEVAFYGGSFTCIPVSQQEELLLAAAGHRIRLSTRPDAVSEEILQRLIRCGVETVELGAQSMDDDVLKASGRGHSSADVVNASAMVKEAGLHLILQMMTGLPGDSREKAIATANRIADCEPDGVRIYPTVIVKDTVLYDLWKEGKYREHTVEEAVEWCSEILPVFEERSIPIIRLGLNPTDDLSAGDAVGGAYHPALGELVRSRVMRNLLEEKVAEEVKSGKRDVVLFVPADKLSQAIGQHRCNVEYLKNKYYLQSLKILMYNK